MNADPAEVEFRQNRDELNAFAERSQLPKDLVYSLREFSLYEYEMSRNHANTALLRTLSPNMQVDITKHCNSWLTNLRWLRGAEDRYFA